MGDNNYDMVNMLTQQIGRMLNPLIQNTNHNHQQLAHKMGQMVYFFGSPPTPIQSVLNNQLQQEVVL